MKQVNALLLAALLIAAGSATADPFADTPDSIAMDDSTASASGYSPRRAGTQPA